MPTAFHEYISDVSMLQTLQRLKFSTMTPVQEQCIPKILQNKDLLVQAKTGSGKTLAFSLPLLLGLDTTFPKKLQSCIIAPTRELANQISQVLRELATFQKDIKITTLCGGTPLRPQANSLKHGSHIVVGTPGRILDHLQKKSLDLSMIKTLILDEADRLLEMGFYEDLKRIVEQTPNHKQSLLFSATIDESIETLSKEFQKDREFVHVEQKSNELNEYFYKYDTDTLVNIIYKYQPKRAIIFCNTKIKCDELEDQLRDLGFSALALHSDLEQIDRDERLICFEQSSCTFLIATDVAARGLDISAVPMVINYDMPSKKEVYIHRIGRTARMDAEGIAVSIINKDVDYICKKVQILQMQDPKIYQAVNQTICISAGKRDKLRKGDILGAILGETKLENEDIKDIHITQKYSYVAIKKEKARQCYTIMKSKKIKKRKFKLWQL